MNKNISDGRSKVAYCICGKKVIAAAVMPYAEQDKEISKDFLRLAKQGRTIDIITNEKLNSMGFCGEKKCQNCEFSNFIELKQNQLQLF